MVFVGCKIVVLASKNQRSLGGDYKQQVKPLRRGSASQNLLPVPANPLALF